MSAPNPTAHSTVHPDNSIWRQHEAQIRKLFLHENKKLKEVKDFMEKKGFPEMPLSTWEYKVRVDLKIRRKLNAPDWRLVHRALAPRLERPGKKRLSRPTTIRFHGREIPLDKAWKEIRRTKAHTEPLNSLPSGDLPPGIEVRTPSPIASPDLMAEQSSLLLAPAAPTSSGSAALQLYTPQTAIGVGSPSITSSLSLLSGDLQTIPWVSLCVNIRRTFHGGIPTGLLNAWKSLEWWKIVPVGRNLRAQDIEDFQSRLELQPANWFGLPRPSHDLGHRLVTARGNIPLSDFVSTAIYLLSNRLHDIRDGDKGLQLLFLLFEKDAHLFTQIMQSEPSAGRATWESLMSYSKNRLDYLSADCNRIPRDHIDKRISRLLLDIGIISLWVDYSDFDVLVFAVGIDCPTNTLEKILDHFCRSGHGHGNYAWIVCITILKLCRKRYFSIANRLIRCANTNDKVFEHVCQWPPLDSVFLSFIDEFDSSDDSHRRVLDCFLSNGADVDKALPGAPPHVPFTCLSWWNENEINRALRPTRLDYSFRANRSLFMKLVPYSKVPKTALTKTGLLVSIDKGPSALRGYLSNLVPAIDPFNRPIVGSLLEFLLDDQFHPRKWGNWMSSGHDIDFKIVRNLVQYAEDLNWHSIYLLRINSFMREVINGRHQHTEQFTDDALQFVDDLLHKGVEITDHSLLRAAVKREGAKILNWLRPRVKNFPLKAAGALTEAVAQNNFQAVQFLVQSGVDTKAFVGLAGAVGHKNFEMVKFLVQSGVDPSDPEALAEAARQNDFEVVDFLLQSGATVV